MLATCSVLGNEELTHRSSETRSPLSTARDSDIGPGTARAQMTSRLASYRSYASQDSGAGVDAPARSTDGKLLILRSLLAVSPVIQGHSDFMISCAKVPPGLLLLPQQDRQQPIDKNHVMQQISA